MAVNRVDEIGRHHQQVSRGTEKWLEVRHPLAARGVDDGE
jgi:hypothetical protein